MRKRRSASTSREPAATGIQGFDPIAGGGLPRGLTTLLIGGPGTGKTLFALETLVRGAVEHDEPGLFVSLEEPRERALERLSGFDWAPRGRRRSRSLDVIDATSIAGDVSSGDFDLSGLLAVVEARAADLGARRIAIDGIDLLLALLAERGAQRRELHRLQSWIWAGHRTVMLTAKADGGPPGSALALLPYLADCIVALDHSTAPDGRALRGLRLMKYRGTGHSSDRAALLITPQGLVVESACTAPLDYRTYRERVATGVESLDAMLAGGYHRGSCVLVSGAPGTAKTTLAGAFADAACRRGERTLFVSFDEAESQIVRNLTSVGLRLDRHVRRGTLRMLPLAAEGTSADAHALQIRTELERHRARHLVIDPLSALSRGGGHEVAGRAGAALIRAAKGAGRTIVATSLLEGTGDLREATAAGVSTIADTWMHLSYVVASGERNRALTVVKSRGTAHSNQVRELVLSKRGLSLADVYAAGGEVLMGTLRWEKEEQEREARLREEHEVADRMARLEAELAENAARLRALEVERQRRLAELTRCQAQSGARRERADEAVRTVRRLRGSERRRR